MLKKHILLLKNIMQAQLERSRFKLNKIKQEYSLYDLKLQKLLISYNIYKKKMYQKPRIVIDIMTLKMYYNSLLIFEKKIILLKKKICKYQHDLRDEQLLFDRFYKKLQIWDILYKRFLYTQNCRKIYTIQKYWNEYYRMLSFKKYFY